MPLSLKEACEKYIQDIHPHAFDQLDRLQSLVLEWNTKINLISRKDTENLIENHFLPSIGFAKFHEFKQNSTAIDVGTGGGFPGLVLAIMLPKVKWVLIDSVGKKIQAVQAIAQELGLKNVEVIHGRVETLKRSFDIVVGRAVTALPDFFRWVTPKMKPDSILLYFKGGSLEPEIQTLPISNQVFMKTYFQEIEDTGKYWIAFNGKDLYQWLHKHPKQLNL